MMTRRLTLIFLMSSLSLSLVYGEGTREVAPNGSITIDGVITTDIAALNLGSPIYSNFATYDNPDATSRLHIHISDPSKESILLGFSTGHLNSSTPNPILVDYEYRILDPNGNVVYGPIIIRSTELGTGIIDNWSRGFNGPQQLGNNNGYDAAQVLSSDLTSQGWNTEGDYYIEFDAISEDEFLIDFWDITVTDISNTVLEEKKGRIWSNNWAFFAINDFGFPNRPFNGSFYVCAPDPANPDAAFITLIDFNGSGFRPAAFNIAFNSFGIQNTGDIAADRRSFEDGNMTEPEYAIFLNDPVDVCETAEAGELNFEGVSRCDVNDFCIKFLSDKVGQVDVLLDFDGRDEIFTPNTADRLISVNVELNEVNVPTCLDWDGRDGLGNPIPENVNTEIPVSISFAQGIYHFPIYDAELMTDGFLISTIRPTGPQPLLYYDDSEISVPSGSAEPSVQLAGCALPCHRWINYTDPAAIGFGNLNTINSWWFSQQNKTNEVFLLPAYYACTIDAQDVICTDEDVTISVDIIQSPTNSTELELIGIDWSGPAITGTNTGEAITITGSGNYSAQLTYLSSIGDTCTQVCSQEVTVSQIAESQIDTLINLGEEVVINAETYNTDGIYTQTLVAANGCDSILTITVSVIFTEIELFCDVVGPPGLCPGENTDLFVNITHTPNNAPQPTITSISWEGPAISGSNIGDSIRIALPGEYNVTVRWLDQLGVEMQTQCGITVISYENMFTQIDTSILLGESIIINGETYTDSGISTQIMTSSQGCDSTITVVVNVVEPLYECFVNGPDNICADRDADLSLMTFVIPQGANIPDLDIIEWTGPGIGVPLNGTTITVSDSGTYTATARWTNAIGEERSTSCEKNISIIPESTETINFSIIEGESINVNGEMITETGQYVQTLIASNGCDSILTINVVSELAVITHDFEDCKSTDYSRLTGEQVNPLSCGILTASNVYRENPAVNAHSCTPGVDGGVAMCISALDSCDYIAGHEQSLIFELSVIPTSGSEVVITGIDFWEKAPATFEWIVGTTGRNNFPTRYGIRILKNGDEIFTQSDIETTFLWSKENFSFLGLSDFTVDAPAIFRFEILPYCLIGFDAPVAAWDIDNLNIRANCDDASRAAISGKVVSRSGDHLSDVDINLQYGEHPNQSFHYSTDNSGAYEFAHLPKNKSYQLTASKNNDPLNGVSTLDVIMIQRHLIGIDNFDNAHDMIAADVNHDHNVSAIDLIELRKLILGIYDELPENTSWKVGLDNEKLSLDYPWIFDDAILYNRLSKDKIDNLIAVKIGDINQDALSNSKKSNDLVIDYSIIEINDALYQVDFYTNELVEIYGLQLGLKNIENNTKVNCQGNDLSDYMYIDDNNNLNISYDIATGKIIGKDAILLSIQIQKSGINYPSMELNELIQSQIYIGKETESINVKLNRRYGSNDVAHSADISTIENIMPNPFYNHSQVIYNMKEDGKATFLFYDVKGTLILKKEVIKSAGQHQIKITATELENNNGMIYCQLQTDDNIVTRRMLLLKD